MLAVASDKFSAGDETYEVGDRVHGVAERKEDDGSLWILELCCVYEECDDCQHAKQEAERSPDGHPNLRKLLLATTKNNVVRQVQTTYFSEKDTWLGPRLM